MESAVISKMLDAYTEHYQEQLALEERLFDAHDKALWQEAYRQRAVRFGEFNRQNEGILAAVSDALKERPVTAEAADFWYRELTNLMVKRCTDAYLLVPVLELLLSYYETSGNTDRLIRVYEACSQIQSLIPEYGTRLPLSRFDYALKVCALKEHYAEIADSRDRVTFFIMYSNLCSVEDGLEYLGIDRGFALLQEMLALWNSPQVQALDGEDQQVRWFVESTQSRWLDSMKGYIEDASPEIKAYYREIAERDFAAEKEQTENVYEYDFCTYEAYLLAKIIDRELTYEEALRLIHDYYKERIAHYGEDEEAGTTDRQGSDLGKLSLAMTDFLFNAPAILIKWMKRVGNDLLRDEIMESIKQGTDLLYSGLSIVPGRENEVNELLAEYCFAIMPYLRDREEKEGWLFRLILSRQLPTYIHCAMVQRLADTIFPELLRDKPQIFADVLAFMNREQLPDFVSKCALFHDVGKNKIASIINMQARALRDGEFQGIRKHPELGCKIIGADPDFAAYADVIMGHHKFYNGQGGYPESFDNTKSPYRSVIDLITLCDCIDAATDRYGRNYKRAKSLEEVLAELEHGKGVRYNPRMTEYLCVCAPLQEKLRRIVEDERIEIAYEIYYNAAK